MPAYQTTYAGNLAPGYEGMPANMEVRNVISRTIETAGGVGFGKPVYQGATDQAVATTGSILRGVTEADHNVRPTAAQTDGYAQGDTVSIMTKGVIWVVANGAVTPGAPAYVTAGGAWSATASGNTAVPNAIFDSTAANGALAKLRVNFV
jgi:hypothetical protein